MTLLNFFLKIRTILQLETANIFVNATGHNDFIFTANQGLSFYPDT